MKKSLLVLSMLMSVTLMFAQSEVKESNNPKGSKGIIANFNNFDLSKGLENEKPFNLSIGLNGYYFFADDWAICPGVNFGGEKLKDEKFEKTLDFSIGLRKWVGWWFLGAWYEGITSNNIKNYEN